MWYGENVLPEGSPMYPLMFGGYTVKVTGVIAIAKMSPAYEDEITFTVSLSKDPTHEFVYRGNTRNVAFFCTGSVTLSGSARRDDEEFSAAEGEILFVTACRGNGGIQIIKLAAFEIIPGVYPT